jgi:hypothetical protein
MHIRIHTNMYIHKYTSKNLVFTYNANVLTVIVQANLTENFSRSIFIRKIKTGINIETLRDKSYQLSNIAKIFFNSS